MEPPVNPTCPICFNLDAAVLRDPKGLEIQIHGNEEFRQSATSRCLACKVIRDGVTRFTRSTEYYPLVILYLTEDADSVPQMERPSLPMLLATVVRKNWEWDENDLRPLWDDNSGVFLPLQFYTRPGKTDPSLF